MTSQTENNTRSDLTLSEYSDLPLNQIIMINKIKEFKYINDQPDKTRELI